jgi:hypothetical protein
LGKLPVYSAYTLHQLAGQCAAWRNAKIPGIMAAIALAESSGNTDAENYCCVGLWQINVLAHPQYTRAEMRDPIKNLQAACSIYSSQGLGAWESYTNGSYKKYLGQVEHGLKEGEGQAEPLTEPFGGAHSKGALEGAVGAAKSALGWTGELAKLLEFVTSSSGWIRIAKVTGGTVLLLLAVSQLSKIGPGPELPGPTQIAKAVR